MRLLVAARRDRDKGGALAKQAQGWFAKAHKADPNHFQSLAAYVEAELFNAAPTENSVEVLLLAHQLAPQVVDITMRATALLLARNHFDDAAILVEPLASDPHNAGLAAAARRMLERARAGQKGKDSPAPAH
jgi:hypothetical protein